MPFQINTVTVTGAGTAVAFDSTSSAPWRFITVKARPVNGSAVYVGGSGVNATAGLMLNAGEAHTFNTEKGGIRLDRLYANADVANDRVDYYAYND